MTLIYFFIETLEIGKQFSRIMVRLQHLFKQYSIILSIKDKQHNIFIRKIFLD
jgi:hypothetical protein